MDVAKLMFTVAVPLAEPPAPVHSSVKLFAPGEINVTLAVPVNDCAPDHAPLAVHELESVDDQVRVAVLPSVVAVVLLEIVTVGADAVGCCGC